MIKKITVNEKGEINCSGLPCDPVTFYHMKGQNNEDGIPYLCDDCPVIMICEQFQNDYVLI